MKTNHYTPPDHEYVLNQLLKEGTVRANPAGSAISGLNLFANTPSILISVLYELYCPLAYVFFFGKKQTPYICMRACTCDFSQICSALQDQYIVLSFFQRE
jgi:hypothetical protein